VRRDTQIALVGRGVSVGNFDACDRHAANFEKVLHVYHADQHGHCRSCDKRRPGDMYLEYLEGTPISVEVLDAIWDFAAGKEDMLIHCAAGLGRGPTLALVALAARGLPLYQGMGWVAQAMWDQYALPHTPQFLCKPLNDIFRYMESDEV